MIRLPRWKRKGRSVSDDSKSGAGSSVQGSAKKPDPAALPDAASFDSYFLAAYRTLRLLERSAPLAEHNLRADQWAVLRLLENNYGPVEVKSLGASALMDRKELQAILNDLGKRGLINAPKGEPTQMVSLTKEGIALLARTSVGIGNIAAASGKYNIQTFSRFDTIGRHIQNVLKSMRARPDRAKSAS
jgi:DNA-binding MarR family transcriptional regulator